MRLYLSILLLLPFYCFSQIPAYYNSIDFNQSGDNLKKQLATLITKTHVNDLVYTPDVWNALRRADVDPSNTNNVLLIYGYNDKDSDITNDRTRNKYSTCHTSSCDGLWVREHVYPRSLGNPNLEDKGPGSDAHHLRSIDYTMNNSRSNKRFAEGSGSAKTVSGNYFYPGDEWRGDVARMMMYMYVRYGTRCKATTVGVGNTSYSSLGDMPNIFLEWNVKDPVSQYEINRNKVLEEMQGNRNPFIDNPYLATKIWNGPDAENKWKSLSVKDQDATSIVLYPTITTDYVYIENKNNEVYNYVVYNSLGQQIESNNTENTIDFTKNAKGIYYINLQTNNRVKTFKVIKN